MTPFLLHDYCGTREQILRENIADRRNTLVSFLPQRYPAITNTFQLHDAGLSFRFCHLLDSREA